jgi:molybdenum cofactor cytidylyltransferase
VSGGTIGGVLLAAGESRRMGFPKPLLKIDDETFIARTANAMLSVAEPVVVVLGAHAERIWPAVPRNERIAIVENPDFARGQLSSLKAGLAAIPPRCGAAMVHLADHPTVRTATFRAVAEAYRRTGGPIVIARCAGRRGHPVIFARTLFAELLAAPEEQGARFVVNADPGRVVYVDIDDPGVTLDLDTPADLRRAGLELPPAAR